MVAPNMFFMTTVLCYLYISLVQKNEWIFLGTDCTVLPSVLNGEIHCSGSSCELQCVDPYVINNKAGIASTYTCTDKEWKPSLVENTDVLACISKVIFFYCFISCCSILQDVYQCHVLLHLQEWMICNGILRQHC